MKTLVFDIETTGLDWKAKDAKMHVMCAIDIERPGAQLEVFDPYEAVNILNRYDLVVGHYIQFFDIPYLENITGKKVTAKVFDTKVIGGLLFPGRKSYHLASWATDLGMSKKTAFTYTDFSVCTSETIEQCHVDVSITRALYEYLKKQNIPEEAFNIETKIAEVIQKQVEYGVGFNKEEAINLYGDLYSEYTDGKNELQTIFPPKLVTTQLKTKVKEKLIDFNPSSNTQIAERLIEKYNWKPKKLTFGGIKKHFPGKNKKFVPSEEAVLRIQDLELKFISTDLAVLAGLPYPECKILVELSKLEKLMGAVSDGDESWLKSEVNGIIHGRVNTTGVITGRMSHFSPNLAQVPKAGTKWGTRCRGLFTTVKPGNVMVGCDASSIQVRCFAHYLAIYDGGEFARNIVKGDIHAHNASIIGVDRDSAKTFIYAFLFGSQPGRLSSILECSFEKAKMIKENFETRMPGYEKFARDLAASSKRGYLIGLDGRMIPTPLKKNERTNLYEPCFQRLNYLVQGAEAVLMKKAKCIAYAKNPDLKFMLDVHDEWQVESSPEEAESIGNLLVSSIRESGEYFNLKCPLDAEFKIGKNWSETH